MTGSGETRPAVETGGPVRLRVLVAAPATGKSTWCGRQGACLGEVLSTDRARAEIGVGEHDHSVSAEAFDLVELRAGRARRVPVWVLARMWWAVRALDPDRLRGEGFVEVLDLRTDDPPGRQSRSVA